MEKKGYNINNTIAKCGEIYERNTWNAKAEILFQFRTSYCQTNITLDEKTCPLRALA